MARPETLLRLHRLHVVRDEDPECPLGPEILVPGMLEIRRPGGVPHAYLLACSDTVSLVTGLWQCRPFPAQGQVLRPRTVRGADTDELSVSLELLWRDGPGTVVDVIALPALRRQVTRLAGQVADALCAAGEQTTATLLNPALAGLPTHS